MEKTFKEIINSNTEHNDSGTCLLITTNELVKLLADEVRNNCAICNMGVI